jgi:hypothetical protein
MLSFSQMVLYWMVHQGTPLFFVDNPLISICIWFQYLCPKLFAPCEALKSVGKLRLSRIFVCTDCFSIPDLKWHGIVFILNSSLPRPLAGCLRLYFCIHQLLYCLDLYDQMSYYFMSSVPSKPFTNKNSHMSWCSWCTILLLLLPLLPFRALGGLPQNSFRGSHYFE